MNDKVLDEFMARVVGARERLTELQNFADDHLGVSPENVSWGDVGNAGYLVEHLTQITDWAFRRGEHAV